MTEAPELTVDDRLQAVLAHLNALAALADDGSDAARPGALTRARVRWPHRIASSTTGRPMLPPPSTMSITPRGASSDPSTSIRSASDPK